MKIGLVAGRGDLPICVAEGVVTEGRGIFVAAIDGFANLTDFQAEGANFGLAQYGKITKAFKRAGCTHVCFAGNIDRPDFGALKPDLKALRHMPGAIKAARNGDDALLRYILAIFEKEGFEIVSPQELCQNLLMPAGHLGRIKLTASHRADAEKAIKTASTIGTLDIGQGAVVAKGLVLAVEAQEGTDAMLRRVAGLPQHLLGTMEARAGVLAKIVKPNQDERVDLPTLGVKTVELVAEAGLAGIVVEAGRAFTLQREAMIDMADRHGIFIAGLPPHAS